MTLQIIQVYINQKPRSHSWVFPICDLAPRPLVYTLKCYLSPTICLCFYNEYSSLNLHYVLPALLKVSPKWSIHCPYYPFSILHIVCSQNDFLEMWILHPYFHLNFLCVLTHTHTHPLVAQITLFWWILPNI